MCIHFWLMGIHFASAICKDSLGIRHSVCTDLDTLSFHKHSLGIRHSVCTDWSFHKHSLGIRHSVCYRFEFSQSQFRH